MKGKIVFLFLLFLSCVSSVYGQKKRFFDYNEGLSNSLINQVYQDHLGFIWVATENGLNRFDGTRFKTFQGENGAKSSLKADFVTALCEDLQHNLWVGLINGLQVYNPDLETFEEIPLYVNGIQVHPYISDMTPDEQGNLWITTSKYGLLRIDAETRTPVFPAEINAQLCSYYLECIFVDKEGVLWIGSDNSGLSTYNLHTGQVLNYSKHQNGALHLPGNDITDLCEGADGSIYIASLKTGLMRYDKVRETVQVISPADKGIPHLAVKSLLWADNNALWVGTDGMGLYRLNLSTLTLERVYPGNSIFDFSKSKIHSVVEDRAGNIWLGVFQKGLYLFPESPELFTNYGYRAFGENSIGSNSITAIEGNPKKVWMGTDGDGIYALDVSTRRISPLRLVNARGETEGNNVLSLFDLDERYLWIGTFFNGLLKYNLHTKTLKSFRNNPNDPTTIANDKITGIFKRSDKELWLSTLGGGVCRLLLDSETFQSGLNWPDSLNALIPKWVNVIYADSSSNVYIGTYDGLVHANLHTQQLTLYSTQHNFLPHNVVYAIKPGENGTLWVGTYGGLVKMDTEHFTSSHYTKENGLSSNVICGIETDDYGSLWLSTHNGLCRFNPADESIVAYYAADGLQANEFSRNASYKAHEGEIYFGGINGVTQLRQDYLQYSPQISEVMLTDFLLFNKPVAIGQTTGKYTILNRSLVLADTLRLREADNVFTLRFTTCEPASPGRVHYEYKMEGFDENWIPANAANASATYTNLGYGTYRFFVRGVNRNEVSGTRMLTILIYPPWYKKNWAKAVWVLLVVLFFLSIFMVFAEKIKHREAEKINEKKMRFFINMSHEIKTPLTLILDPLEKLMRRKNSEEAHRLYRIMEINANRIYRLVNQLLDVRKIDKGQLLVKYQLVCLLPFVREVARAYEVMAENKNIDLVVGANPEDVHAWIDPLNFEKVILNLLSNAFKYSVEGGKVEIEITGVKSRTTSAMDQVQIVVSDAGPGIPKGELEKIFERFYQAVDASNPHPTGTGIGLHLSRSLVEIHGGKLYAQNKPDGTGARFVITLPLGHKHLPAKDLILDENNLPAPGQHYVAMAQAAPTTTPPDKTPKRHAFTIFIVDDEPEIREYLRYELGTKYTVFAYENGNKAWHALSQTRPDLVICDIMMPEMDGITLCKKIKGNVQTSHIPVILLTALSKDEDRAEGIETGADLYLVKPFNSELLSKTVQNVLENRRRIHQQWLQKSSGAPIQELKMESHDEILMQKIMSIIKENIHNSALNVEMLADGVGISRVHMHRKLKALTNQSAREFIKGIRMKQAAYILVNKKLNITEVAYAVGYENLSHFSSTFKAHFGVSPKEYIKSNPQD